MSVARVLLVAKVVLLLFKLLTLLLLLPRLFAATDARDFAAISVVAVIAAAAREGLVKLWLFTLQMSGRGARCRHQVQAMQQKLGESLKRACQVLRIELLRHA